MKKLAISAVAIMASGSAAFATECVGPNDENPFNQSICTAVPEITALEGTAALAALAAIVLIAWERRRRAV